MRFTVKTFSTLFNRGDYAAADRACREELAVNPSNDYAWHYRGVVAIHLKEFERAVQYFLRTIFHAPGRVDSHVNLGIALRALGRWDEAIGALTKAVKLDPTNFEGLLMLASTHLVRREYAEADCVASKALELRPQAAEAWDVVAMSARRLSNFYRAADAANKAIAGNPSLPDSHQVLADVATREGDYERAERHYLSALALNPESSEVRSNFGLLLNRMGRLEESAEQYRRALDGSPGDAQLRYGLAIALLAQGHFEDGWTHYGARAEAHRVARLPGLPTLDRLPTEGERIAVTTDQGPGEQIMFASLLPDLSRTGAILTLTCDARLVELMRRSFPALQVQGRSEPLGTNDFQIGLADAARWLRPAFESFPRYNGYLKADPFMTDVLRARYAGERDGQLVVGISWRTIEEAKVSSQKSIALNRWGSILPQPGVTFVCLQYGECESEIRAVQDSLGVRVINDRAVDALLDLDSLAAQIAAMDLVITTSNTTAHLAGALNVPTWVFVPAGFGAFWHWFLGRSDSPWYPSVRLFRQAQRGDWRVPLEEVSTALAAMVKSHSRAAS